LRRGKGDGGRGTGEGGKEVTTCWFTGPRSVTVCTLSCLERSLTPNPPSPLTPPPHPHTHTAHPNHPHAPTHTYHPYPHTHTHPHTHPNHPHAFTHPHRTPQSSSRIHTPTRTPQSSSRTPYCPVPTGRDARLARCELSYDWPCPCQSCGTCMFGTTQMRR
jgi:hypothetical protein